jgi:hypothetical protein
LPEVRSFASLAFPIRENKPNIVVGRLGRPGYCIR